ncbi:MAG: ABC transporter substrate-binding protein [Terriglobia bacterium]
MTNDKGRSAKDKGLAKGSAQALILALLTAAMGAAQSAPRPQPVTPEEQAMVTSDEVGRYGGRLVVAERTEPKTLNPVVSVDSTSREVIGRMTADLIHINRQSLKTEPALARSWTASRDGRSYTLKLRRGLRFSDGHSLDADDVVFTFRAYLDEKVNSPQRDLLIVGGKPIAVAKLDAETVRFDLAQPYAAAERLFDGLAILPRHLLEKTYQEGKLGDAWGLSTAPAQIAGLGPFRLKDYVPGQRLMLERNPYYWKLDRQGGRLPYLDEITFLFVASEDAQVMRFESGETDMVSRLSSDNFAVLEKQQKQRGYRLQDLGPGLEYNFLFFNQNDVSAKDLPQVAARQSWFREPRFRQAVSAAVDRAAIVRLVYRGRGTALWSPVTPGNRLWVDAELPHPPRSLDHARELLRSAGFTWRGGGALVDARGQAVEFTIVTSTGNTQRNEMATLIGNDLSQLGMVVHVVPLEFRALLDRLFQSHDYEACVLGLVSGDADPNPEMNVWLSSGGTHVWHVGESQPATPWEAEIDRLMKQQLTTLLYPERKRLYDRVQELIAEQQPIVSLASPNILVGAKEGLGNFRAAVLDPYTLWNAEELFWEGSKQ